jgi:hypothetical protein
MPGTQPPDGGEQGCGLADPLRLPGALVNIPWDYLYDARHGFVGLDPQIALACSLELPVPLRPFPISLPLRILAMISAPSDIAGLQIEQEWAKLNGALAASATYELHAAASEGGTPATAGQTAGVQQVAQAYAEVAAVGGGAESPVLPQEPASIGAATSVIYDAFFGQRMAKSSIRPILRYLYVRSD